MRYTLVHKGHVVTAEWHGHCVSYMCRRDRDGLVTRFEAVITLNGSLYDMIAQKSAEDRSNAGDVYELRGLKRYADAEKVALNYLTGRECF